MLPLFLFALLPLASAINTAIGCAEVVPTTGEFAPVPNTPTRDNEVCASRCEAAGVGIYDTTITYSYNEPNSQVCRCFISAPTAGTYGACVNGDFYVRRIRTTFDLEACYSGGPSNPFERATIDECFDACRTSRALDVAPVRARNIFQCACSAGVPPSAGQQQSCDAGVTNFYRFAHDGPSASQGLVRRRRIKARKEEDYCPGSLTACRVPGSRGYECIDISSELESCGGCMYGEYSDKGKRGPKRGKKGINCSTLDNAVIGATTCKAGRCVDEF